MSEEEFLTSHCHLVPIVLRNCFIYPTNADYDDYRQLAYKALIQTFRKHPHQKEAYYFQAMKWRIQDEKYRHLDQEDNTCEWKEEFDIYLTNPTTFESDHFLEELLPDLTNFQRDIIRFYIHHTESFDQFLERHHCSSRQFYKARRQLKDMIQNQLISL